MTQPYYQDESVTLYHGDCRDADLAIESDLIVADPPYGETSLKWDEWPEGWVDAMENIAASMWVFGSMRMFLERRDEFRRWRMSQDVVWEKNTGTGMATDRFARVHEHALHWYRGDWSAVYHASPRVHVGNLNRRASKPAGALKPPHLGGVTKASAWEDDGTRLLHSVFRIHGMHRRGVHPTEKPTGVLEPLIEYGCPLGGLVFDPCAGSGAALVAARNLGRKAVGVEIDERYCEIAARRLAQAVLDFGEVGA